MHNNMRHHRTYWTQWQETNQKAPVEPFQKIVEAVNLSRESICSRYEGRSGERNRKPLECLELHQPRHYILPQLPHKNHDITEVSLTTRYDHLKLSSSRSKSLAGQHIAARPPRSWTRSLATEVDLENLGRSINAIDQELQGAVQETKSIESRTSSLIQRVVPHIDSRTQATQNLSNDGTAQMYRIHKRQRRSPV